MTLENNDHSLGYYYGLRGWDKKIWEGCGYLWLCFCDEVRASPAGPKGVLQARPLGVLPQSLRCWLRGRKGMVALPTSPTLPRANGRSLLTTDTRVLLKVPEGPQEGPGQRSSSSQNFGSGSNLSNPVEALNIMVKKKEKKLLCAYFEPFTLSH